MKNCKGLNELKYNKKKMSFKEKIKSYLMSEIEEQLENVNSEISSRKEELNSLKKEIFELRNSINDEFNKEKFEGSDYTVNMKNCYVISLDGKNYITIRSGHSKCFEMEGINNARTIDIGIYVYQYYDTLYRYEENGEEKLLFLCEYKTEFGSRRYVGRKPEYEEHILNLYPELLEMYENGWIPVTHLKKIYYEINDLSKLIPSSEQSVSKVKKLN